MYMKTKMRYNNEHGGENVARTAAEMKNDYAKRSYDDIRLQVKKGMKQIIRDRAKEKGETLQGYIKLLISEDMGISQSEL